jgi:hypothetical protein
MIPSGIEKSGSSFPSRLDLSRMLISHMPQRVRTHHVVLGLLRL